MDTYTLPELIWAVAMLMWPICILIIAILYRKNIIKLIFNKLSNNKQSYNQADSCSEKMAPSDSLSTSENLQKKAKHNKKHTPLEDEFIPVEVCKNLESDLYFILIEEKNDDKGVLILPTGDIKILELCLFGEIEEKNIRELLKDNILTKEQLISFERYISDNAKASIDAYLKNPEGSSENEPPYVDKYRRMLNKSNTIPSRMFEFIKINKKTTWYEIKNFMTNEYGYSDSGSYSASLRVLLVDGFINIDGQGDNKNISISTNS